MCKKEQEHQNWSIEERKNPFALCWLKNQNFGTSSINPWSHPVRCKHHMPVVAVWWCGEFFLFFFWYTLTRWGSWYRLKNGWTTRHILTLLVTMSVPHGYSLSTPPAWWCTMSQGTYSTSPNDLLTTVFIASVACTVPRPQSFWASLV